MIQFIEIEKSFGKLKVLDKLSLELASGGSVAVIGPNGSGKTTLLKVLLGMVMPDAGTVTLNRASVHQTASYRSLIGYMPQISRFPSNLKIHQLFRMMKEIRTSESIQDTDLYEQYDLDSIKEKALSSLSGGTRQKVAAALAFYFNPPILILDEPTAGLDPLSSEVLKDKIKLENSRGKLVIVTSHILSDLEELTERVVYLQDGKVFINKSMKDLKNEYQQDSLSKIIAELMMRKRS